MRKYVFLLLVSGMFFSCLKEKTPITISGITETKDSGEIISEDPSDWNFTDSWNADESNLFSFSKNSDCDIDNQKYNILAIPNPTFLNGKISIDVPENNWVSIRLVDEFLNIYKSYDSLSSDITVNYNFLNISGRTMRVYYKVFGDNCELRGHGDIQVR